MERTLLIIKPNAYDRAEEIISKVTQKGLTSQEKVWGQFGIDQWKEHYQEHQGKPFFEDLCSEMADKNVMAVVFEGNNAVQTLRNMLGNTDPAKAQWGSLRQVYGESVRHNGVHASDSIEAAQREIQLWIG